VLPELSVVEASASTARKLRSALPVCNNGVEDGLTVVTSDGPRMPNLIACRVPSFSHVGSQEHWRRSFIPHALFKRCSDRARNGSGKPATIAVPTGQCVPIGDAGVASSFELSVLVGYCAKS
jgi:hypothetical protein